MAESSEYYENIITQKAAEYPELSELEANPSRASEWLYVKKTLGFFFKSMAEMVEQHKAEVALMIQRQELGDLEWYRTKALAYQHGDPITRINNVPGYNVIDPDKQIIRHCSCREVIDDDHNLVIVIKAAKGADALEPLDTIELAGLTAYLENIKFGGVKLVILSLPPDQVYYEIDVQVNQSIIDVNSGCRLDGSEDTPIYKALNTFHKAIGNEGVLYLSRVEDAVQKTPGVIDARVKQAYYRDGASWIAIDTKWESTATYMVLDEDQTTINYS